MKKNDWLKAFFSFLAYMAVGVLILAACPDSLAPQHENDYAALVIAYFAVAGVLLTKSIFQGVDLFEPFVFVTVLYLMIFCFAPIVNVIDNNLLLFGANVMDGCVKATLVFVLSYCAFAFGYLVSQPKAGPLAAVATAPLAEATRQKVCQAALLLWLIAYAISAVPLLLSGRSLLYIMSAGAAGENVLSVVDPPLGFASTFAVLLIPAFMYVFVYGKNKPLKVLLFTLTFTAFLIRGFRYIMIIALFAPVIYSYLRQNKRPNIAVMGACGTLAALMIGLVGFARRGIRYGQPVDWSAFDSSIIAEAIMGNFEIYKPFYGLMNTVPDLHDYTWGEQMFYTVIMLVPRALWPDKPLPVIYELLGQSASSYAVTAGAAWPNLGEFYSEFGLAGSMVFMLLFGMLLGWSKKLYQGPGRDSHSLIAYAVILPATLQLVIRGYTPSNFYLMAFLLLPVYLLKRLAAKRRGGT